LKNAGFAAATIIQSNAEKIIVCFAEKKIKNEIEIIFRQRNKQKPSFQPEPSKYVITTLNKINK
jgi:hypothetical protein